MDRRVWTIACAVLFVVGLAIAGAARSGPRPAAAVRTEPPAARASRASTSSQAETQDAVSSANGPTRFDTKTGTSERPTPLPVVYRTYGEDAYGSGRYGR